MPVDTVRAAMKRACGNPAMVVALLALFLASTAGAFAAGGAFISGSRIRAHSIPLSALTPAAIRVLRGRLGPAGPPGQPGTSFDPSKVTVVTGISADVAPGQIAGATVACPAGAVALGGGGTVSAGRLASSLPTTAGPDSSPPGGWSVIAVNDTTLTIEAAADAVCLSP
jgi:hypothetical protein